MNNTYWQDAQGRVYKVQGNEQPLTEGITRINRDAYRKRIREQERARFAQNPSPFISPHARWVIPTLEEIETEELASPALDSHTAGESANEVSE